MYNCLYMKCYYEAGDFNTDSAWTNNEKDFCQANFKMSIEQFQTSHQPEQRKQ